MSIKTINLDLKSKESWDEGGFEEALEQAKNCIAKNYKNNELTLLGEGGFASVFKAVKVKSAKEKNVAVRIMVTDNPQVLKQEKRPDKFFKELKDKKFIKKLFDPHDDAGKQKPNYYAYINVPKLKYEINFTVPKECVPSGEAYGVVFESELADRDAWPREEDMGEDLINDSLKYLPRLIKHVAKALKTLHSQGKIHSDLKPNNILVKNNGTEKISFQLTDFGTSWKIKEFSKINKEQEKENIKTEEDFESWIKLKMEIFNKLRKRSGQNEDFSAPEKTSALMKLFNLKRDADDGKYELKNIDKFISNYNELIDAINNIGPKSDIYSFGKTIQVIAVNRINMEDMYTYSESPCLLSLDYMSSLRNPRTPSGLRPFEPRPDNKKDAELEKLIIKMTDENPANRPSAKEILDDPYLK